MSVRRFIREFIVAIVIVLVFLLGVSALGGLFILVLNSSSDYSRPIK